MDTNDTWTISPDMLGYGNSDNSFYTNQIQSTEGAEIIDYIRITKNYDPATISLLLYGHGFTFTDEDRQRFNELFPKYGFGKEEQTGSNQSSEKQDDLSEWDWDLYSESQELWIEEIKAKEVVEQSIEVNKGPDALPEEQENGNKEETEGVTCTPNTNETKEESYIIRKNDNKKLSVKVQLNDHAAIFSEWKKKGLEVGGYMPFWTGYAELITQIKPELGQLLTWLWLKADHEQGYCSHSRETMAEAFGISPAGIDKRLKQLVKLGLIKRVRRHNSSSYTLLTPYGYRTKRK
ncbi:winged helix-turn-helix domain-containing protein [Peribacillus sp. NPDC076916]|uniref:winged helix-turn-helix domain-containing protein n=1 Tax=Peribacillus sp. NPDC076916 TaxID=3390608 RepID=UPI003D052FB3